MNFNNIPKYIQGNWDLQGISFRDLCVISPLGKLIKKIE